jgi:hypothetical protein
MPSFIRNTSGGTAVSGGALAPRSRRGSTNQADGYWRGGGIVEFSSFESIATVTVGSGGIGSISFSSIPQTYKHLQVRALCKTNRPTYAIDEVYFSINGDGGSNYAAHNVQSDGASASSAGVTSQTLVRYGIFPSSTTSVHASMFSVAIIDLVDYTNTNKYKTVRSLHGYDTNATATTYYGYTVLSSGLWMNTNAITTFTIVPLSGPNFVEYSQFALYGIKG